MERSLSSVWARRVLACLGALLLLLIPVGSSEASAQDDEPDEVVIFVLDLSGSMNEPFDADRTKLDVAKAAFVEAFTNVSPDARVGLRTYGDQIEATVPSGREPSCTSDTRLASPVAPLQRDQLIGLVEGFSALGDTPMGLALLEASTDIPDGATGTIVLFSDGRDECFDADLDGDPATGPSFGDDPCEIARSITSGAGGVDRVVTVGFRADAAAEGELRCIADSTGGTFTSIETPEDARDALPELLVSLSAPREAQRSTGQAIAGATSLEAAPDLLKLDTLDVDELLYTDSINMGGRRIYKLPEIDTEGVTVTATLFGLPAEPDIAFDMWIFVSSLSRRFFEGDNGDFDAGLPARPTTSIRCTDCVISGGPYDDAYLVVDLTSSRNLGGTFELELLTAGTGFGGPTTSCHEPQACFYPQAIVDGQAELDAINAELATGGDNVAPQALIDERDQLRIIDAQGQAANAADTDRAAELEARIPLAPVKRTSFRTPLLMIVAGAVLAFAPLNKLKRSPKSDDQDDETPDADDTAAVAGAVDPESEDKDDKKKRRRNKGKKRRKDKNAVAESAENDDTASNDGELGAAAQRMAAVADSQIQAEAAASGAATAPIRTGPSLDVGPAPAVSPTRKGSGHNWDAELEAAKEAMAQQRPARPSAKPEQEQAPSSIAPDAAQQAAAQQAAAQQAAAQQAAAEQAASAQPAHPPAGWFEDPTAAGQYRWWDGANWTTHTSPTGQEAGPS